MDLWFYIGIGLFVASIVLGIIFRGKNNSFFSFFGKKNTEQDTQEEGAFEGDPTVQDTTDGSAKSDPNKPIYVLYGYKGVLKVYENKVEIKKTGSGFISGNSQKTLPIANIMSVSLTPSTVWARGFIEFTVPGGRDSKNIEEAMRNENALPLDAGGQNEKAQKIKAYIEELIMNNASNKGGNTTIIQQSSSSADELKKYKELLDSGIITQEEFDAKKKQLLNL